MPHTPSNLSDTQTLLDRARSGESAALSQLFHIYEPQLLRFVHGRLPATRAVINETPDVVQEVWLRAMQSLDGFEFRGVGSFWAWLRTIAHRFVLDQARRAQRRGTTESLEEDGPKVPRDGSLSPRSQALYREDLERFEVALAELSERERHAFLMRIELGLSFQQVADECGFPGREAARKCVVRTTQRLGRRLGEEEAG